MKQYVKVLLLIFFLTFVLCGCSEDVLETYDKLSGRVAYENFVDGKYSTVSIKGHNKQSAEEKYLNFTDSVKKYAPFIILAGIGIWVIFLPLFHGVPAVQKKFFWFGLIVVLGPILLVYGMAFVFTYI